MYKGTQSQYQNKGNDYWNNQNCPTFTTIFIINVTTFTYSIARSSFYGKVVTSTIRLITFNGCSLIKFELSLAQVPVFIFTKNAMNNSITFFGLIKTGLGLFAEVFISFAISFNCGIWANVKYFIPIWSSWVPAYIFSTRVFCAGLTFVLIFFMSNAFSCIWINSSVILTYFIGISNTVFNTTPKWVVLTKVMVAIPPEKKWKLILFKVNNNQHVFSFDFNRTFKVYKFYYTLSV